MENKNNNNTIVIVLLSLIVGLFVGYLLGINTVGGTYWMGWMHGDFDGMQEHMFEDHNEELISGDGFMQHAMEEMTLGFRGLDGQDYEEAYLKGMIVHHIGAIEMSEALLDQTDRPELTVFAEDIIKNQSAEIEQMKEWLNIWFK